MKHATYEHQIDWLIIENLMLLYRMLLQYIVGEKLEVHSEP